MTSLYDITAGAATLLQALGVYEVTKGAWAFTDVSESSQGYLHHSHKPVAMVAYAVIDPIFARGRFPGYALTDLVDKIPCLDGDEYAALARVCGAPAPAYPSAQKRAEIFGNLAWEVVADYGLEPCFMEVEPFGNEGRHYAMRPRGYDPAGGMPIEADLKAMRQAYKAMTPLQQVMTLTLLHLYTQGQDKFYLTRGCLTKIPAADAVAILNEDGVALSKWGRLLSHYAGW